MSEIAIQLPDQEEFSERVIAEAASQLLALYVADEDGNAVRVPTELARQIRNEVIETIREQAREATPEIAAEMLESGVQQTDEWGSARGGIKPLRTVVAEEAKASLTHSSGRRGQSVLDKLIREEVQRQIKDDLKEALDEAKRVMTEALTTEAVAALRKALEGPVPF